MNEVIYLNLESSGWLYLGAVRFFNFGVHLPTLVLFGAIVFVALRARKIVRDKNAR